MLQRPEKEGQQDVSNKGNSMSNMKHRMIRISAVFLTAVITAFLVGLPSAKKDYGIDTAVALDLTKYEYVSNDAQFDPETGIYTAAKGGDSYLLFSNVGQSFKGVFVKLDKPADSDITVKVYWTGQNDELLSETLSESRVIHAGSDSAFIRISSYPLGYVRVNISDDCVIGSMLLASKGARAIPVFSRNEICALIIRTLILFIVFYLAELSFEDDRKKGRFSVKAIFSADERGKDRMYELDYVRTVAAVMVIMMHSICDIFIPQVSKGDPGYGIFRFVLALSLGCNALYVMLSGCLILIPKEESLSEFYKKRLVRVVIPTLCYYGLYMLLGYRREMFADGILQGLKNCGRELLSGKSAYMPHIWLVYTILGLYIIAPFLRILLKHITDRQLFGLLIAGFVINVLFMYLPLAGMSFDIETPIASWLGLFLLGYYMNTEHASKHYILFIILGIIGFIASFAMIYHDPDILYYTCNQAPNMWLVGCGVFAFFGKFKNIFGKKNVVIAAFSKYNFSIMLVHVLLLMKLVLPVGWRLEYEYGHLSVFIVLIVLSCLVLSYLCALVYDNTAVKAAMYVYDRLTGLKKKHD